MDHTSSSSSLSSSSSQSSPLLALPPELIEHIISLATESSRRSELKGVLFTCKKLHEITLPFWVKTYWFDERSTVFKFLRYITITQPGLAACVKKLELLCTCNKYGLKIGGMQDRAEASAITNNLLRSAYPLASGDYEARGYEPHQTAVHTLLAACSMVETLVLPRTCVLVRDPVRSAGSNAPEPAVRPLSALRHVTLTSDPHYFNECLAGMWWLGKYRWLKNTVYLLQLPNIRDFDISEATGLYSEQDLSLQNVPTLPEGQSNVENMRIHLSVLSPPVLRKLVRCSKRLKTFEYSIDWFLQSMHIGSLPQFRAGDAMEAIQVHAGTLEALRLEFGDDFGKPGQGDLPDDRVYLGLGLRQMTALKILSASMQALTGLLDLLPIDHPDHTAHPRTREGAPRLVQCLPPNLEELTITNCGRAIVEQAQELLDAVASGSFPHLRVVALAFNIERPLVRSVRFTCAAPDVTVQRRYEGLKERSSRVGLSGEQLENVIAGRRAAGLPVAYHH